MPAALCVPLGRSIDVLPGETLLDAALRVHLPLASSCAGHAVCGDCIVRVLAGAQNVEPPDADELAWRRRKAITVPARLACCLRLRGDVEVTTTYW